MKAALKTIESNLDTTTERIVQALNNGTSCDTSYYGWLGETITVLADLVTTSSKLDLSASTNNFDSKLEKTQTNKQAFDEQIKSFLKHVPLDLCQQVAHTQAFVHIAQCLYHPAEIGQLKLVSKYFKK